MKRVIGILLIFVLMFVFAACGGDSGDSPVRTISPDETGTSSEQETPDSDSPDDVSTGEQVSSPEVTVESTFLLDQDGLKITAKELIEDPIWGTGIAVLIENDSDQNLGVQCNSLIINNYMIPDVLFSSTVAAGKKANDTIYLSSPALEAAGINTISDIVISFHVFDGDSYETLFDTDEIELRTSAYGTVEQPAMDDGRELFNQDGIRIIGKYVDEDSFWGAGILLFIENNYGENIMIQCDNMSINGFMVTPFFSSTVHDGRMALDEITIMSGDLEDNNIERIEEIELVFNIIDPDTFQTLFETDPISFTIE
ncbi:MAG TPA: hypothetical protein GXZ37_08770 [Clostridiales bacterium]|jgi:hypothetical protein|nr:hypothetical protein [Clostridiales bacterium]